MSREWDDIMLEVMTKIVKENKCGGQSEQIKQSEHGVDSVDKKRGKL